MFGSLVTMLAPYKTAVYAAGAALVFTAVLAYGHLQYLKGAAECKQGYAEAQAEYQQKVRKEERKKAEEAIKQESKVSKQIGDLSSNKRKVEDEARELARKANRPSSCALSDDELRYYEEAVRSTE